MSRIRYDNQGGFLGADPGSGGTTITFAVAPDFATITGSDYIPISLDPGKSSFEIVWLTAYTASATTGTITRAAEDGTLWPAVAHPNGSWTVAPTVADMGVRPWLPMAGGLLNGWTDDGGATGQGPCSYRLTPDGQHVELRGLLNGGSGSAFVLPVGFRPAYVQAYGGAANPINSNTPSSLSVSVAGGVAPTAGSCSLDGIVLDRKSVV